MATANGGTDLRHGFRKPHGPQDCTRWVVNTAAGSATGLGTERGALPTSWGPFFGVTVVSSNVLAISLQAGVVLLTVP